MTKLCRFLSDA